jgi:hypothetical protein
MHGLGREDVEFLCIHEQDKEQRRRPGEMSLSVALLATLLAREWEERRGEGHVLISHHTHIYMPTEL